MNITNFVSVLGTIFSIYLNFSPTIPFIRVFKKKEKIDIIHGRLLFCQIADRLLWGTIWIFKNKLIPFINCLFGIFITSIFILLYFYFYYKRIFLNALIRFLILFGIAYFIFLRIIIYGNISVISFFAIVINIFIYIAELKEMIQLFKGKNYKLFKIDISIVGVFCYGCWIIYGNFINFIPQILINLIGFIFSLINTIAWIYFYYNIDKFKNK